MSSITVRVLSLFEGVGIALDSLKSNRVRAALTILGVAVGVFVVVVISAAIHGINASVARDFEKAGPKTFFLSRYPITFEACDGTDDTCKWRHNPHFNLSDAQMLNTLPSIMAAEAQLGLSKEVQDKAVDELVKDKDRWVAFMMKHELNLDKPDPKRARKSAFNIGMSYVVGGLVPLSPYFFIDDSVEALKISVVITLICLFVFGYFKSKMTGVNPWTGGLKVMMIGAVAAGAAFTIAKLIEGG